MSGNGTKQTIRDTATPVTGDFQQAQDKNFRPEVKTGDKKEDDKRNHENNKKPYGNLPKQSGGLPGFLLDLQV